MSQGSSEVLSVLRSLAIFTAFALGFYFLVVWNPVDTLGDVRNYLEHRVRVPVEWIVVVFPVAWLIQRNIVGAFAIAFLVTLFVVILALTKPDYGAEFWRIFRYEVYLNPIYAPRGLLVCFFLLAFVLFAPTRWKKTDQARAFLLCLVIGFGLTSWEALITPAPPHDFEGGSGQFVGQWTEVMWAGWMIISQSISQYIPPDYQNAVRIGVSVYPLFAFFLLLFPSYRKLPEDFFWKHREDFPIYLFVGALLGLSFWAFFWATRGDGLGGGTKFLLAILSIPATLALIVVVLSSIFWIPAGLFLLPAYLFWVVSQPFKLAYFLAVKVPFMVLHYLHYLLVPHPLEEVIKKHEEVRRRGAVDYGSFAEQMAKARYNRLRDGIPTWWKSKNWERRLRDIMALRGRVQSEKNIADEYTEEFRNNHRQQ